MKRLVIDTCFSACSVALVTPETSYADYAAMQRGHAEALMPMLDGVMRNAGLAFTDLDEIVVTNGPGTFTGMRVGIATARALALAAGVTLKAVGTLQLMAYGALDRLGTELGARPLAIAVDARKGQIYFQPFDGSGRALDAPRLLDPASAMTVLQGQEMMIAGNGAGLLAAVAGATDGGLIASSSAFNDLQPDARDLGLRNVETAAPGSGISEGAAAAPAVRPLYLRAADAKPQIGKSIARAQ